MELIKIELVNILSHQHTEISFDTSGKCTSIIGPNGSGKSNIRRAISLVLENWPSPIEQNKYPNFWDKYSDSSILLTFRLSEVSQRILKQWLFLSAISFNEARMPLFGSDSDLKEAIDSSSILSLVVGYERNNQNLAAICICKWRGMPRDIPGSQGFIHMDRTDNGWKKLLKLPAGNFSYTLQKFEADLVSKSYVQIVHQVEQKNCECWHRTCIDRMAGRSKAHAT
jgi:energy-coupling factor transporter ATP-binding protein EcfA2